MSANDSIMCHIFFILWTNTGHAVAEPFTLTMYVCLHRMAMADHDMAVPDYDGRTAIHLAAAEGHLECVRFLLEKCKVSHNPTDRWGITLGGGIEILWSYCCTQFVHLTAKCELHLWHIHYTRKKYYYRIINKLGGSLINSLFYHQMEAHTAGWCSRIQANIGHQIPQSLHCQEPRCRISQVKTTCLTTRH